MKNTKVSVLGPFAAMGIAAGAVVGVVTDLMGLWILLGALAGMGVGLLADAAKRRPDNEPSE